MRYVSTRGGGSTGEGESGLSFSEAVAEGLAPDGGLFVPRELPDISARLDSWEGLDYPDLCLEFLKFFADDICERELAEIIRKSYARFDAPDVAPLRRLGDKLYMLELFHGPTLAFKDFALQFVGNLYEYLLAKSGKKINVLGATSGDTGSAAINGLLGKDNVNIFILYPEGRISPVQERQIACTGASNVFPVAVDGTFDDAQSIVKDLFGDSCFKSEWNLSAVNSINLARIVSQSVYYVYAWLKLPRRVRSNVQFIVPTGNFGNVFAGWLAGKSGLPSVEFKVATNRNDILWRLFNSGVYELSKVEPSYAPSMDIQVASNFERFLYYFEGGNCRRVREIMDTFKREGKWVFDTFPARGFSASRMDDAEILDTIGGVYRKFGVVVDPHTACAFKDLSYGGTKVVLSTAHPAKFPEVVGRVVDAPAASPVIDALAKRNIVKKSMPASAPLVRAYIEANGLK